MVSSLPQPVVDLAPAEWLVEELTDFGAVVGNLVPPRYARYARILHRPDQGLPMPGDDPLEGTLDRLTLPALRDVLGRHTADPTSCWFALWHGYGNAHSTWRSAPTFRLPGREYWLFAGSLEDVVKVSAEFEHAGREERAARGELDVVTLGPGSTTVADQVALARAFRRSGSVQSPNLWWPSDRSWCVASEIDLDSTVVAGGDALVDAVLDDPMIEAVEVGPTTSLLHGSDDVNLG